MNSAACEKIITDYDVLIVGGGPAGISTWLHLNLYNPDLATKTIVIDKDIFPREKLCGGGIGGWSGYVLKRLNISLDIPRLSISDIEFVSGKKTFTLHQPHCFTMVQRIDFDHLLVKEARKRGLTLYESEQFIDFRYDGGSLLVRTDKNIYKVKVLIGADGALSRVRKSMDVSNKPHIAPTLEIFSPAHDEVDKEFVDRKITVDLSYITQGLQGYIWHVPHIKNGNGFIGHGMVDFHIHENKPKANMANIFSEVLQSRNISLDKAHWRGHPIRWYANEDVISVPQVLLVGDAVGIEPAFGGGIHFALSYGEVAAKTVIDAFRSNDFHFMDYNKKIQSHLIGKWIAKCTSIALQLYDNKMDHFEAAKEVFTIKPLE